MKNVLCLLSFFALTSILNGQTFIRQSGEAPDVFAKRIFKVEELAHPIIETNEWDANKKVIICFFELESEYGPGLLGYTLTPLDEHTYQQTLIDSFNVSGGISRIEIESVFFANADKDKEREIIITTKSKSHSPKHADNDVEGYYFDTYFYDNYNLLSPPPRLYKFIKFSNEFSEFDGMIYDIKTGKLKKSEQAKYKDPSAIRLKLKEMGY